MASSLPPPPPPPPDRHVGVLSGRTPTRYPGTEWGLGDAFVAMAVFFATSVIVGGLAFAMSDGPGLEAGWLPVAVAVPALAQLAYVVWAANAKGRGLGADFAVGFRPSDLAVGAGLFVVLPRLLSPEAWKVLRPNWVFAVGLLVAFLVFGYFCVIQLLSAA